jgi:hypothetical protein
MSAYEILAVAALAAAGGFAYYLYRSDTKPGAARAPAEGQPMFARDRGKPMQLKDPAE